VQWDLVRGWLTKAGNDLLADRPILEGGMRESYDTVSFYAQQAAEKALKALLVRHQVAFRKGHNLAELLELVESGTREALQGGRRRNGPGSTPGRGI
jgi:HEPN domain-containing protein